MTRGSFKSSWFQSIDIFLKSVKEKSVCLLVHRWLKSFKMTWVSLMMSGCLSQMLSMILVGRVYLKYCLAALWVFLFAVPKKINLRLKITKIFEFLPFSIFSFDIPMEVDLKKWQPLQLSINTAPCSQKSFSFLRTLLSNKSRQVAQATIERDDFVR